MISRRNRYAVFLTLAVVLIAAASIYSLYSSYRSEVESHRRVLLERGETVLDALKAGILAHGRMGRYRADRLTVIFEELARNPRIVALELRGPDGVILVAGGQRANTPDNPVQRPLWTQDRLVMSSRIDLLSECGRGHEGRGRQGGEDLENWVPFAGGDYVLTAALDTADVQHAIRRHQLQLALSVGANSVALGLGTLVVVLLLKRADLAAALERERERLRRQERIAQLGAGLAHETKNPLGIVRGLAQSIGDCSYHTCPIKDRAKSIVDEVDRVIGVINSFLTLARPQEATPGPVDLDHFLESFLPLVQMDASAADVHVTFAPCHARILADEAQLRRAVLNLVLNALHASRPGQTVQIDTLRANSHLSLRVSDSGCGISQEDLPKVTDPYFTRFPGGSGLGLSIVEQIAAAHGWRLRIRSELGQGTQVALEGVSVLEPA